MAKVEVACVGHAAKSRRLVRLADALGRTAQATRQYWESAAKAAVQAAGVAQGGGMDLEVLVASVAEGLEVEAVAVAQAAVMAMRVAARCTMRTPRTKGYRIPSERRSRAPFCKWGCTR